MLTPTIGDLPTEDQAVTLSLFDDLPGAKDRSYRAVLVRPHMRRMSGDAKDPKPRPRRERSKDIAPKARIAPLPTPPSPTPATPGMDGRMSHFVEPNKMVEPAPHNGTQTSKVAAIVVAESGTSATYRARVLECIRLAGERGITRADIEAKTGLSGNTIRPRVYELLGRQKDSEGSYPAPLIEETDEVRIPDCGGKVRQKVLRAR